MATNTEKIVVQVVVQGQKDLQKLGKTTESTTLSFGKMAAGVVAAAAAFKQVNQIVGGAIRTFRDFEFQMAKVKAISGANRGEFTKLSKTAQELGRTTFFTAQQVAELQTNYSKLGFTTQEILDAQEATLQLATATDSDLARAATVAGAAVRGFGLDASETKRVVDVMTVAFTSSAMDLEKWQTSMTKVAPIAKSAGFSIEETAAIMSKLTDAGIEASIAGTSLRNILLKMQSPNSDLVKSFGKTIHSYDQLLPAMRKFVQEGGNMADIMEVVDLRQAAAFEQMLTSSDATEELIDKMNDASGSAERLAKIIGDTFEGAMKRLTSASEGLAIVILEDFGGALKETINDLAELLNKLADNKEEIKSVINFVTNLTKAVIAYKAAQLAAIVATKAAAAAVIAYEIATGTASMATKRLIVSTRTLTTTMMANPYVAVGALVAALATDLFNLRHQVNETETAWEGLNEEVFGDIKVVEKREKLIQTLKSELATSKDLADAKRESALLEGEIATQEALREKTRAKALEQANQLLAQGRLANEGARDMHVDFLMRDFERNFALKRQTKQSLDLAIANAKVTNTEIEQTEATKANSKAKQTELDLEKELLEFKLGLWMEGKLSEEEAQEVQTQLIRNRIEELKKELEFLIFSGEERKRIMQEIHDLEQSLNKKDEVTRQTQIEGVAKLGEQLINLAGEDEKMQGIRKIGIQISTAAAIANNLLALSNAAVGVTQQSKLMFPANIVAMVTTLATVMSLIANIKALKDTFGDGGMIEEYANGGMVHGRSHAQGGEKFAVGGRVVELEGGEAVINKRSTAMFRNQLSAMNAAGGGVKFADGGMLNNPAFAQQQFNALGQSQMMGAMGGQSKVVVVEADITESQNTVSVIQSDARI